MRRNFFPWHPGLAGEGSLHRRGRHIGIRGDGLDLATITSRKEDGLGEPGCAQALQQLGLALLLDIEGLAQGRRSAAMTHSDDEKLGHGR